MLTQCDARKLQMLPLVVMAFRTIALLHHHRSSLDPIGHSGRAKMKWKFCQIIVENAFSHVTMRRQQLRNWNVYCNCHSSETTSCTGYQWAYRLTLTAITTERQRPFHCMCRVNSQPFEWHWICQIIFNWNMRRRQPFYDQSDPFNWIPCLFPTSEN